MRMMPKENFTHKRPGGDPVAQAFLFPKLHQDVGGLGIIQCHNLLPLHCPQKGPYYRDQVPIGTFLASWVPIGSLFILQGPYFRFFGFIYAKNVNSVCMYTTMSYLDLSVMSNDLQKK